MNIFLKPVQRWNPAVSNEPMKCYPVQYTTKMVAETEEPLSARNVKTVNMNFLSDTELKNTLQKAGFAWLNKIMDENIGCDTGAGSDGSHSTGGGEGRNLSG